MVVWPRGMSLRRRQWATAALVICLPLGAISLLSETASASCGDYVIFRPAGHMAAPMSLAAEVADHSGVIDRGKAPCQGPMCRGNRPLESAPTPAPMPRVDERPLALLSGASAAERPELASGWIRFDESPRDGYLTSLLRPPCA